MNFQRPNFALTGNIKRKILFIRKLKIYFADQSQAFIKKKLRKSMKKVSKASIILAIAIVIGIAFSSCKSTQQCPSYGEVQKYQKEVRR